MSKAVTGEVVEKVPETNEKVVTVVDATKQDTKKEPLLDLTKKEQEQVDRLLMRIRKYRKKIAENSLEVAKDKHWKEATKDKKRLEYNMRKCEEAEKELAKLTGQEVSGYNSSAGSVVDKVRRDRLIKTINKLSPKQALALQAFKQTRGNVTKAHNAAGVSRVTWHNWINKNPDFKQAIEEAKEERNDDVLERFMQYTNKDDKLGLTASIFYLKKRHPDFMDKAPTVNVNNNNFKVEFVELEEENTN